MDMSCHNVVTGPIVLASFHRAVQRHGIPASTLTDNGMVFTTRFAGGRGGRNAFETELRRLGVRQKNSRPSHPQTCGKVCEHAVRAAPGRPDPGQGMTTVSFARSVGRPRCCALVRAGRGDLT
jgi:hypothetical protein